MNQRQALRIAKGQVRALLSVNLDMDEGDLWAGVEEHDEADRARIKAGFEYIAYNLLRDSA